MGLRGQTWPDLGSWTRDAAPSLCLGIRLVGADGWAAGNHAGKRDMRQRLVVYHFLAPRA